MTGWQIRSTNGAWAGWKYRSKRPIARVLDSNSIRGILLQTQNASECVTDGSRRIVGGRDASTQEADTGVTRS